MKHLIYLGCSLIVAAPALAQDSAATGDGQGRLPEYLITVTAAGSDIRLDQTGQAVSVIGRAEIDAVQGADLARLLERLPGVSLSRNGGLGAQTGLNVRGANADQVLVLVDGVRVADFASPGGGYDLGNLLSGGLGRVELLRGSNSVVWGSQAMGGVLAVTTREVNGAEVSGEYGAWDTALLDGTMGLAQADHAVSLSAGYARTDGFSAQSAGTEADGYEQWRLSGRGRLALSEALTLRAVGRYADSTLDIDLTGPDSPDVQHTREGSARIGLDYVVDSLALGGGLVWSGVRRHYETGWGPSTYKGQSRRAELAGRLGLPAQFALDFGGSGEWTRAESSFDARQRARTLGGHALLGRYGRVWSLAAGLRVDDHSRFGTHATLGANGTIALARSLRLRASYGEGFKAPTLYQLYGGFVGNAALKPERSRSYDAGLEWGDRNARLHFAATLFRRDSRNLIDLDASYTYGNVARARAWGFELEAGAQVSERFTVQAAYTYTRARDLSAGRDLARRPRHLVTFSADWRTPLHDLTLGGDIRMASDSVEYNWLGAATRLDGYAVATLRASVPLAEKVDLFGRVENLGDAHYATAAGFATPGRSAHIGARARF